MIYELVCKQFLGSVSKDALIKVKKVSMTCGEYNFSIKRE